MLSGFLLDENIIEREELRKYLDYLDTTIHGVEWSQLEPIFVRLSDVQQSSMFIPEFKNKKMPTNY